MKAISEWINSKKEFITEGDNYALFSSQKDVDAATKKLQQQRSLIVSLGVKKDKEWEYDVPLMMKEMAEEWNRMLESYSVYPALKVMKYQGILADCLSCLWNMLVSSSVGQPIGPGYRSINAFSKLGKILFKMYDRVLLVKPIALKF